MRRFWKAADPAQEAAKQKILRELALIELHRHRVVLGLLECLLDDVPMSPQVAREVITEITERRKLEKAAISARNNATSLATYYSRRVGMGCSAQNSPDVISRELQP